MSSCPGTACTVKAQPVKWSNKHKNKMTKMLTVFQPGGRSPMPNAVMGSFPVVADLDEPAAGSRDVPMAKVDMGTVEIGVVETAT